MRVLRLTRPLRTVSAMRRVGDEPSASANGRGLHRVSAGFSDDFLLRGSWDLIAGWK